MDKLALDVIRDYCKIRAKGDADKYLVLIDQMLEDNGYSKLKLVPPSLDEETILYGATPSKDSSLQLNESTDSTIYMDSLDQTITPAADLNDSINRPGPSGQTPADLDDSLNRPGPSTANNFFETSTPVRPNGSQTDESNDGEIASPVRGVKRKKPGSHTNKCPFCNSNLKNPKLLKQHIASQICVRVIQYCTKNKTLWKCNMCAFESSVYQATLNHLIKCNSECPAINSCVVCNEDLGSQTRYSHINENHPDYWKTFGL